MAGSQELDQRARQIGSQSLMHTCCLNCLSVVPESCYNTDKMNTSPESLPSNKETFTLPERNPVTHAAHRREVLLQISMPLLIGVLLVLAAIIGVVWAGVVGSPDVNGTPLVSRWADVSLLWLLIPALIFALIFLILLGSLVYALTMLLSVLPGYARLTQDFFLRVQEKTKLVADKLVEPVLKLHSFRAGARALRKK